MRALILLLLALLAGGCMRAHYRRSADRETYGAIGERIGDPRWALPRTSIIPEVVSRLYDPTNPDRPPMPPDDPAAHRYMHRANGMKGYKKWHKDGDLPWIESPHWRDALGVDAEGNVRLTPENAVELGLLHSREYQTVLEDLYLTSLTLTLNRFEFAMRYFLRNSTFFNHFGSSANESNTLTTATNLGFNKTFAAGGQLLVDFANSFVFEYAGTDNTTATGNIGITFIQPLLRQFGREVCMEALTQGERNLLYAVRDFARFRKQFTFDIQTGAAGYLSLLFQLQTIRNLEANLDGQEQNLRLHEAQFAGGVVSLVQVDQSFQNYQRSRAELLSRRTDFENALDAYKTQLGLPPGLPVQLDDSLLAPFQLTDPALTTVQRDLDLFFARYRELEQPPPLDGLRAGFAQLRTFHAAIARLTDQVEAEVGRWKKQLDAARDEDAAQARRQRATQDSLARQFPDLRAEQADLAAEANKAEASLNPNDLQAGLDALRRMARLEIAQAAQLFVVQNQARVNLIELPAIGWQLEPAVAYAKANRLDLMNQRGRVTDQWRKITVAADGLEADFNVVLNADIATPPDSANPFDFRASASRYRVGFQFDGPLNRQAERNTYRASLITFQRARRDFMALDDFIERSVRRDLRTLETERLNFEIARQSLISAARQVEGAREILIQPERQNDPAATRAILDALSALLETKSNLIRTWVNYQTGRLQLLLDLEALQLDARGLPLHEHDQPDQSARGTAELCGPSAP